MHKMPFLMERFATIVHTPFQISTRLREVTTNFFIQAVVNESNKDNDVDLIKMWLLFQTTRNVNERVENKES